MGGELGGELWAFCQSLCFFLFFLVKNQGSEYTSFGLLWFFWLFTWVFLSEGGLAEQFLFILLLQLSG